MIHSIANSRVLAACLGSLLAVAPAAADGTIDTTDATIEAGAASAPGAVVIDECAPVGVIPTYPAQPQFSDPGSLALPLPGPGSGADDAVFVTDAELAAGEHLLGDLEIAEGVVVTALGAVTLRCDGDVTISGRLISAAAAASITIECGGRLVIGREGDTPLGGVCGVETTGSSSPISLDGSSGFSLLGRVDDVERPAVRTVDGAITIRGRNYTAFGGFGGFEIPDLGSTVFDPGGLGGVGGIGGIGGIGGPSTPADPVYARGVIELRHATIDAGSGDVELRTSAGGASFDDCAVHAETGDIRLLADVELCRFTRADVNASAGSLSVYARRGALLDATSLACAADLRFESPQSGISISGPSSLMAHGVDGGVSDIHLVAKHHVRLVNTDEGAPLVGHATLPCNVYVSAGHVDLLSQTRGAVEIERGSTVSAPYPGVLSVLGLAGIATGADGDNPALPLPTLTAGAVSLRSAGNEIALRSETVRATHGALFVQAARSVSLVGCELAEGATEVRVIADSGTLDVRGATVLTSDADADVHLECAGDGALIDAASAVVRSGAAEAVSGDVRLTIYETIAPDSDLTFTPGRVRIGSVPCAFGDHTRLEMSGRLDDFLFGYRPPELTFGPQSLDQPFDFGSIHLFGFELDVDDLEFDENGTAQVESVRTPKPEADGDPTPLAFDRGVEVRTPARGTVTVQPVHDGSGKSYTLDVNIVVESDTEPDTDDGGDVRVQVGDRLACAIVMFDDEKQKKRVKTKRDPAAVVEPEIRTESADVRRRDGPRDSMDVTFVVPELTDLEPVAADVTLYFGEDLELTVPAAEFVVRKRRVLAKQSVAEPRVRRLSLDYATGRVRIVLASLELGERPEAATQTPVALRIGDGLFAVTIPLVPRGKNRQRF